MNARAQPAASYVETLANLMFTRPVRNEMDFHRVRGLDFQCSGNQSRAGQGHLRLYNPEASGREGADRGVSTSAFRTRARGQREHARHPVRHREGMRVDDHGLCPPFAVAAG